MLRIPTVVVLELEDPSRDRRSRDVMATFTNETVAVRFLMKLDRTISVLPTHQALFQWPTLDVPNREGVSFSSTSTTIRSWIGLTIAVLLHIQSLERWENTLSHGIYFLFFDTDTRCTWKVIEGYDLVERISKVPTRNDNPVTPIKMITVRVA